MISYEENIRKACKFIFNMTNLDTIFFDSQSKMQITYGYFHVPKLLKPYLRSVYDLLLLDNSELENSSLERGVAIHKTAYKLNFLSTKLFINKEFLGNVVIGPYLFEEPGKSMIEDIIYRNNISISLKNQFIQYYSTVTICNTNKVKTIGEFLAFSVSNIDTLCSFRTNSTVKEYGELSSKTVTAEVLIENNKEYISSIKERYRQANEIMYAVETGDLDKIEQIILEGKMRIQSSLHRIPDDPLRSSKNISIVFNTLLRKAAEKGGLHPIDIHSISDKYAIKIEQATSISQLKKIADDMKFEYCDAVKRFTLKNYSFAVRKAIEYIRQNIDSELSLDSIASAIGVSHFELSRKFSKETQKSIIDYINTVRINEAIHIMERGEYPLTEIALMVGFNDASYFTRVFKKIKGMSPSEYMKTF